jgi:predicted ABC-type ATPase
MSKPILLVIAGCNGSGKSSFSKLLATAAFEPFDYDYHYLKHYNTLFDSDIREIMAHNMAFSALEENVQRALNNNQAFCYETNFNSTPLYWPQIFQQHNFELRLIYLCLNSIEEAQRRVDIRVENGGHFVSKSEIEKRYFDGFENLNNHFSFFKKVDLFETSTYGELPSHILSIENNSLTQTSAIPAYLQKHIPEILKLS